MAEKRPARVRHYRRYSRAISIKELLIAIIGTFLTFRVPDNVTRRNSCARTHYVRLGTRLQIPLPNFTSSKVTHHASVLRLRLGIDI